MLKITVELWPHGRMERRQILAEMELWNDGTGTPALGNYEASAVTEPSPWHPYPEKRGGKIVEHPRNAPLWSLIAKMLHTMGYEHAA